MQPSKSYNLEFTFNNHSFIKNEMEGIHVSQCVMNGPLFDKIEGVSTLYDLLKNTVRRQPNDPFLGWHDSITAPYQWWTYEQVNEKVEACGSGLLELPELVRKEIKCVGVYASNCPTWMITEFGCWAYGMTVVTLYDTLGQEAMIHICNEAELTVAVCDTPERARKLIKSRSSYPELKYIILVSPEDELEHLRTLACGDMEIITFEDLLARGFTHRKPLAPHGPDDIALICYTSGTTGTPKGPMITSRNLLAVLAGTQKLFGQFITKNDVILSFLPLAHIYEQFCEMYIVYIGGKIGFYSGNVATVSDDMKILKPTIFTTVPRLLCRIFDAITQKVSKSPFKKFLLNYALKEKCHQVDKQVFKNTSIWDTLVFSRIRSKFGGNLRLVLVAGAPVSPPVLRFTRAVFSCPVIDGYGCTELCGPASASYGGDITGGHVGAPYPCVEIKLCDVPEMELVASRDNKGEICIRGASCVSGYYKNPEASKQLIDEDGWLHTGDVGIWVNNCLRVVDRCKHIFKLAQGEYVAPEKLEIVYQSSPLIAQIFVDGDSQSTFPVALVIPEPDPLNKAIEKHAARHSTESPRDYSIREICEDPRSKKIIMQELYKLGEKAGLMGFEKVKNIKLLPEPFTIDNSLLTPTLKVARPQVRKTYASTLADLYREGIYVSNSGSH